MTSFEARIGDALCRAVPLRVELEPDWSAVIARAEPRRHLTSRWALVAAVIVAAGLGIGGLALADAFGPLHRATIDIDQSTIGGAGGISSCGLVGKAAGQVAATLASSGISVEWRFTHWGTTTVTTAGQATPTAPQEQAEASAQAQAQEVHAAQEVTGGSSDAVSSVPGDSVVWDVVPDGQTKAFVFVEAPNDPNAPTVSTDNCPG